MRLSVEVDCPRCGRLHRLVFECSSARKTVACGCGAVFAVSVQVNVKDYTDILAMLPEYVEWLVSEKRLQLDTARTYARHIERWIREGRFPRYTAPFDYFREFLVRVKGWHPMLAHYALDV